MEMDRPGMSASRSDRCGRKEMGDGRGRVRREEAGFKFKEEGRKGRKGRKKERRRRKKKEKSWDHGRAGKESQTR